jgi:hypothetical protein
VDPKDEPLKYHIPTLSIDFYLIMILVSRKAEMSSGSSHELMHICDYLFEPISELLFFGHLGFYRAAAPTHHGIIFNPV